MYCEKCNVHITARTHICLTEKECQVCHITQKIACFPVHPSSFDGHKHSCTSCWEKQQEAEKERRDQAAIIRIQQQQQRQEDNRILKEYGYRWKRVVVEYDEYDMDEWQLFSPDNHKVSKEEAFQEIDQRNTKIPSPVFMPQLEAVQTWARTLAATYPLFLDTETTGLGNDAEVIDLALIAVNGDILVDTLVSCQGEIASSAFQVHGITQSMLKNAPTFPTLWQKLFPLLCAHDVVIYNAPYDLRLLKQTAARYSIPFPDLRTHCLMQRYSASIGELGHAGEYRNQKLDHACRVYGIECATHRAVSDAEAARQVFLRLAS